MNRLYTHAVKHSQNSNDAMQKLHMSHMFTSGTYNQKRLGY